MGIVNQYQPYQDEYGLVHPGPPENGHVGISHNGLRFTGEMVLAFRNHGALDLRQAKLISRAFTKCEKKPGLLKRHPKIHQDMQQGPDDYIWAMAASKMLNIRGHFDFLATHVLRYGKSHWWIYNNVNPGTLSRSAFLGRFPAFRAHAYFAAGKRPGFFARLAWCGAVIWASRAEPNDQDAWALTLALVITYDKKFWLCRKSAEIWLKAFKKAWPSSGYGGVLKSYFNQRIDHPSARFLWGYHGDSDN